MNAIPFAQNTLTLASRSAAMSFAAGFAPAAVAPVRHTDEASRKEPPAVEEESPPQQFGVGTPDCYSEDPPLNAAEAAGLGGAQIKKPKHKVPDRRFVGTPEWQDLGQQEAARPRLAGWLDQAHFDRAQSPSRQAREIALQLLFMPMSQRVEVLRLMALAPLGDLPAKVERAPLNDLPLSTLAQVADDREYVVDLQGEAAPLKGYDLAECVRALGARLVLHSIAAMQHLPEKGTGAGDDDAGME